MAHREVVRVHGDVVDRGCTGHVVGRLGPDVDARGVDRQREGRAAESLPAVEDEGGTDAGFHGKRQPGHLRYPPASWPGTVHDSTTGHHPAGRQIHVAYPLLVAVGPGEAQVDHPVGQVLDAVVAGPLLEAPHQRVGVQGAFVPQAQASPCQVVDVQVRKPIGQLAGVQQCHLGAA